MADVLFRTRTPASPPKMLDVEMDEKPPAYVLMTRGILKLCRHRAGCLCPGDFRTHALRLVG